MTRIIINRIAKRYGIRTNKAGALLDAVVDTLDGMTGIVMNPPASGYAYSARLNEEQVRLIRKSRDKLVSIAAAYQISEGMVRMIKKRSVYKWVN